MRAVSLVRSSTPAISRTLKPFMAMLTLYVPDLKSVASYSPDVFVVNVRRALVLTSTMVTLAFGPTAAVASVTVPRMVPRSVPCACNAAGSRTTANKHRRHTIGRLDSLDIFTPYYSAGNALRHTGMQMTPKDNIT